MHASTEGARVKLRRAAARQLKRILPAQRLPDRAILAAHYLHGDGIEIGALHRPLLVPVSLHVRYVDRMPVAALRQHYAELENGPLVPVDIVDDGERLSKISDASQDFVIANHFLEHCQDPIGALSNMLRVLRRSGILFLTVPDKRQTFDAQRPLTPLDHLWRDHEQGPEWSRQQHYEEFAYFSQNFRGAGEAQAQARHLVEIDYSIHFHVWTEIQILELLLSMRERLALAFDVELMIKSGEENIFIVRA
jgi:predicted SAM-dependent methyltransferase